MHTHTLLVLLLAALMLPLPASAAQPARPASEVRAATTTGAPVNINTAGVKELMALDGIGHAVAEKIVEYRQKNGPFTKPEELRKVSGVGKGLWERNRGRIVVK